MSDKAETEVQVPGGDETITGRLTSPETGSKTLSDPEGQSTDCRELFDREYLEGLDIRELIAGAEKLLRRYHFDELWLVDPFATEGSSDWRARAESARGLAQLEEVLGKRLVGGFECELHEDQLRSLYHQVGGQLVEGFYASMIQGYERVMGWWTNANWGELFRAGILSDDDYRHLMEEYPDRNPRC